MAYLNAPPALKLLLIDDDPTILGLYAKLLRKKGYETFSASSAAEALEIIDRGGDKVDGIVSDINMSGLNGVGLYQAVEKRQPELAKKIIFITGGIFEKEMMEFFRHLPNLILKKPFEMEEFLQAVSQMTKDPK